LPILFLDYDGLLEIAYQSINSSFAKLAKKFKDLKG
jgi:hypothetical protein